jgi:hypothetical protein
MNRIWALNASSTPPTLPSSLETGYIKDTGDATVMGPWWFHMITETLLNPIVAAGITPSNSAMDQLTQAIGILAAASQTNYAYYPVRAIDTVGVTMSGIQVVDGVTPVNGDRILRNAGGDQANNGPWLVNSTGAWTRPTDWLTGAVVPEGIIFEVSDGTVNLNSVWTLDVVNSKTAIVDTTFVKFIDITASTKAMFAGYLTTATAASTYLTQAAAASTYAQLTDIANFITLTYANGHYLSIIDAANTYAPLTSLTSYLLSTTAASTYETKSYIRDTPTINGIGVNCAYTGAAGNVFATGDLIASYSDDRLKTRTSELTNALDRLDKLTAFFYRPSDLGLELGAEDRQDVGLSAQEMEQVLPEVTVRSPVQRTEAIDGEELFKTIRYERVVPLLVQGIKEVTTIARDAAARATHLEDELHRLVTSMRGQPR